MLETKLWSSGRATSALNHGAILPAPYWDFHLHFFEDYWGCDFLVICVSSYIFKFSQRQRLKLHKKLELPHKLENIHLCRGVKSVWWRLICIPVIIVCFSFCCCDKVTKTNLGEEQEAGIQGRSLKQSHWEMVPNGLFCWLAWLPSQAHMLRNSIP